MKQISFSFARLVACGVGVLFGVRLAGADPAAPVTAPEINLGARLFSDPRFAQFFFAHCAGNVNRSLGAGDPVLELVGTNAVASRNDRKNQTMSCLACHPGDARADSPRSPVPKREDGHTTSPRNSPSLVDALVVNDVGLLHYDGEFRTPEELVEATFTGRNFGWLPTERDQAIHHFARVIREDDGTGELAAGTAHLPYVTLLQGMDAAIPDSLRLRETFRIDPRATSDEEILAQCSRLVVAYLRTLHFSRDVEHRYNGSPYDSFLRANRLPLAPREGETAREYTRRLGEQIAALRTPRFIDGGARFGAQEFQGMKIFFRAAIGGLSQNKNAGNCAECHVPPHFTDFKFHNTGVSQDEYDSIHGSGSFAKLELPALNKRNEEYGQWLQPTPLHPHASGHFLSPSGLGEPNRTDLGLWNVYGNPDIPAPQPILEKVLNSAGTRSPDDVLTATVGAFKTPTLRGLGNSGPYLHNGRLGTIEEVVVFYRRMSELSRNGHMRNPPPEFFAVRLADEDVAPLAAFLRALNE